MQSDISRIRKETDEIRHKLTEPHASPLGKDEVVLSKDLLASLLQQSTSALKETQTQAAQPKAVKKKKKRGNSLKGFLMPVEKVVLTRKGGGGFAAAVSRRISHSPTYQDTRNREILPRYMRNGGVVHSSVDGLGHHPCRSRYCLVCRGDYR